MIRIFAERYDSVSAGAAVGGRTGGDGVSEAELEEGRSVRPRLVLNIDSDSDE